VNKANLLSKMNYLKVLGCSAYGAGDKLNIETRTLYAIGFTDISRVTAEQ
jgi:hypothetical protein